MGGEVVRERAPFLRADAGVELAANRLVGVSPRLAGPRLDEGLGLLIRRGGEKANVLFPEALDGGLADPIGRGGEKAVLHSVLVHFCLRRALQKVSGAFGFDGQKAFPIVESTDQIGMAGGLADLQRNALVGIQAAVLQEGVMRIREEVQHRAAVGEGGRRQEGTDPFDDGGFSHRRKVSNRIRTMIKCHWRGGLQFRTEISVYLARDMVRCELPEAATLWRSLQGARFSRCGETLEKPHVIRIREHFSLYRWE